MNIYEALANRSIRDGILRSLGNLSPQVEKNLKDHPYLLEYAEELKRAKSEVVENFDFWIDKASKILQAKGVEVFYARDANEARNIAEKIVGTNKIVVKAKSMVSEEVHLREHLEKTNNEVWETDLGELIVQLANDKPMHSVIPALHYSEEQVAEILKKIGISGKNAEELAKGVRNFMRKKFLNADVGISGCNAFSAETGRIFLIENEGNIRLSTTIPKRYIVLVGIEKILPNDELALKSVLVQAAFFGTFPPTYINVNEKVAGQEMYVIFIDNGRKVTEFKDQLFCIRCGRCQLECPVFQNLGNVWGGSAYGGPMGVVWTAITEKSSEICFLSTLCGKCREVCPMKINIPEMMRKIRRSLKSSFKG